MPRFLRQSLPDVAVTVNEAGRHTTQVIRRHRYGAERPREGGACTTPRDERTVLAPMLGACRQSFVISSLPINELRIVTWLAPKLQ